MRCIALHPVAPLAGGRRVMKLYSTCPLTGLAGGCAPHHDDCGGHPAGRAVRLYCLRVAAALAVASWRLWSPPMGTGSAAVCCAGPRSAHVHRAAPLLQVPAQRVCVGAALCAVLRRCVGRTCFWRVPAPSCCALPLGGQRAAFGSQGMETNVACWACAPGASGLLQWGSATPTAACLALLECRRPPHLQRRLRHGLAG